MAPFPLIKLAYLAVKQVSKPIANAIKRKAKSTPFFRKYICMPPAQIYHWLEINFRLKLLGLGSAKNVEKLSEKDAIELGGEMLGEFIVFSMAVLVVIAEYQRGARKEAVKEEKLKQESLRTSGKLNELETITGIQEAQIRDLQRRLDLFCAEMNEQEVKLSQIQGFIGKKQS